jgi:hypothetical protein
MAVSSDKEPSQELHLLPDCPELALFVANAFQRLGGYLTTDSNGQRYAGRPECVRLTHPDGHPQLPEARPWEQFHSDDEWRGAIKLADYWLARLSRRDKDFVFTLCAPVCIDPHKSFDFRGHLQ